MLAELSGAAIEVRAKLILVSERRSRSDSHIAGPCGNANTWGAQVASDQGDRTTENQNPIAFLPLR